MPARDPLDGRPDLRKCVARGWISRREALHMLGLVRDPDPRPRGWITAVDVDAERSGGPDDDSPGFLDSIPTPGGHVSPLTALAAAEGRRERVGRLAVLLLERQARRGRPIDAATAH